jgi:chromosome segregation ATPase
MQVQTLQQKQTKAESLQQKLKNLELELSNLTALKEKYVVALEAVHADLKDAESENEQLHKHYDQLKQQSSPKRSILPQSTDSYPADGTDIENQRNCIRYLLADNIRLKSIEYTQQAMELFHPSDALTKLALTQKIKPDGKKTRLVKEFIRVGSCPSVVDVRKSLGKWTRLENDPVNQLLTQREKIKTLVKKMERLCDIENVFRKKEVHEIVKVGRIQIPGIQKTEVVALYSSEQLQDLHSQFICVK